MFYLWSYTFEPGVDLCGQERPVFIFCFYNFQSFNNYHSTNYQKQITQSQVICFYYGKYFIYLKAKRQKVKDRLTLHRSNMKKKQICFPPEKISGNSTQLNCFL